MYDNATGMTFNYERDKEQDRSIVEFFNDAVQNDFKSAQEGRPVFDEVEKVRIIVPGDKAKTEVIERVKEEHRQRWPAQYAQFKQLGAVVVDGTPIEEWPPINKAWAMNLKALNIFTVEHLAAVNDANLANIGLGAREKRDAAIAWLANVQNGQPLAEAQAREQRLKDEVQTLSLQVANLQAVISKLEKDHDQ